MEPSIFNKFQHLIYEKSGISLGENKEALVSARVGKRLRELKLPDFKSYLAYLKEDDSGEEIVNLLDVISTNVTSFYREANHFDLMDELVKKWLSEGQRKFRFWCAASSSGEEPYTIAMTFLEAAGGTATDTRMLATDISTRILSRAQEGRYPEEKTAGIPASYLDKYFQRENENNRKIYTAKESIKSLITFKRLNLSVTPFPMSGPMDIVFCRNVMIYFDNAVRKKLLMEIERLLKPGGYLFVGHSESLTGQLCGLKNIRPAVYVKE
jgi:chemotaxis protein methyltransferase CheR